MENKIILIRGGGDLASGVAVCLHEAGYSVVITELAQPLVVRRQVSFAEAVYEGTCHVEGIIGRKVEGAAQALDALAAGEIAVLVDPECEQLESLQPWAIVDGRMLKHDAPVEYAGRWRVIGLGPGFTAGMNCWVAIETNRGANLGKILLEGSPEPDTGRPAEVMGYSIERVLYAHREGQFKTLVEIGDQVQAGQTVAKIDGEPVRSQISGILRGLLRDGLNVAAGVKVGDVDPTGDKAVCFTISDKARKVGGAVVETLFLLENLG